MLSNIPTYLLAKKPAWLVLSDDFDNLTFEETMKEIDDELESRAPNEIEYYFGDCAGKPIFIPIEPECDDDGYPIFEEMIGYDGEGNLY